AHRAGRRLFQPAPASDLDRCRGRHGDAAGRRAPAPLARRRLSRRLPGDITMNDRTIFSIAPGLVLAALLATGCGSSEPPPRSSTEAADTTEQSWIGRQAAAAIAEAQRGLETENIRIGENSGFTINGRTFGTEKPDGLPRAEISPQGDFLIQGEVVPVTGAQRELLLEHRRQLVGLAHAGMAIGIKGA